MGVPNMKRRIILKMRKYLIDHPRRKFGYHPSCCLMHVLSKATGRKFKWDDSAYMFLRHPQGQIEEYLGLSHRQSEDLFYAWNNLLPGRFPYEIPLETVFPSTVGIELIDAFLAKYPKEI